jgi:outer membrane receptor for monomeric catechols
MARTKGTKYQHDWNDNTWTSGAPTTAAETLSGTTESLTGSIDCETYYGVQITADINYDANPTDSVTINVYGSVDGTNFDDTPIDYVMGDNTTDPEQLTIMVWNPPAYMRIGFVQSGATDSHDISTVYYIGFY